MRYILRLHDRYYYNRRVPNELSHLDHRVNIRVALKTDSKEAARRKSAIINEQVEAYWLGLLNNCNQHEDKKFKKAVQVAREMGFSYQPMSVVATLPIEELVKRLLASKDATPAQEEAILGGREEEELTIRDGLKKFWLFSKDRIVNKTDDQVRKWKNARQLTIENLIKIIGNKNLKDLTQEDIPYSKNAVIL